MSRLTGVVTVVVGLGLAGGFGALAVDSLLDFRAFSSAPRPVTVAQLAAMTSVARGTWVSVVDAVPDCRRGYSTPGGTHYVLVGDAQMPLAFIAALDSPPPCERLTSAHITGVPSLRRTVEDAPGRALPHGLAWRGVDWQRWPEQRVVVLWTWSGRDDSRTGIWLGAGFALLGLWLVWYGTRWLRPRLEDAVVMDPSQFPSAVQLGQRGRSTLPATVVWLPVLRTEAVTARGVSTDVTLYELELPAATAPLATRAQRTLSTHTGPGVAGLIFRSHERNAVCAARPAGSDDYIVIRSDLAQLQLSKSNRAALRARHLR